MREFSVPEPDEIAAGVARARQMTLTKPAGSLGFLEELSIWCASVQGKCPPTTFTCPGVVILAGDHGIASVPGISAYPSEVTAQMVLNFTAGGAAANVLARQHGALLRVFDIGVKPTPEYLAAVPPEARTFHVKDGSGRIDRQDAMTSMEAEQAWQAGSAIARSLVDDGVDLVIPGDMGIGNTSIAAAVIGHFTDSPAALVTGTGTGIGPTAQQAKTQLVGAAMERMAGKEPWDALVVGSSPDFIAMCAMILVAIDQRVPVLIDGVVSAAACLAAEHLAAGARRWMVAGHRSTEPAQSIALSALDCRPILDLGMRLGEGSGALTALPILQSAAATLAEMATFDQAHVSDRTDHNAG